jgi:hypothetical protein
MAAKFVAAIDHGTTSTPWHSQPHQLRPRGAHDRCTARVSPHERALSEALYRVDQCCVGRGT